MKTIRIEGWDTLNIEGDSNTEFICSEKVREGGVISVRIGNVHCSCDIALLESVYLSNETSITFGEAASAIDRAFDLALNAISEEESANLHIVMHGKFIHEDIKEQMVNLDCDIVYSIVSNGKKAYELSALEMLSLGKRYKELAVKIHGKLSSVLYKYPVQLSVFLLMAKAIKWLSLIQFSNLEPHMLSELTSLKSQCYNNLSHFHLEFKNYRKAVSAANKVLEEDENNVKALYRRGMGNLSLQNYELAQTDFGAVLKIDPSNAAAKRQLDVVSQKIKSVDVVYAQAMKKFLSL